jgi:hypothetical protein
MIDENGYPALIFLDDRQPSQNDKGWNKREGMGCRLLWEEIRRIDYIKEAARKRTIGYKMKQLFGGILIILWQIFVWSIIIILFNISGCELSDLYKSNGSGSSSEYDQFDYLY